MTVSRRYMPVVFNKGWFSTDYESSFHVEKREYVSVAHYVLHNKARLFANRRTRDVVLRTLDSAALRALDAQIDVKDELAWMEALPGLLYDANYAKFSQNPELLEKLMHTEDRPIGCARKKDSLCGIGFSEWDKRALDASQWEGMNLYGQALMSARWAIHEEKKRVDFPVLGAKHSSAPLATTADEDNRRCNNPYSALETTE
jgi:ribA/ribD-fused uncharacterized protein